MMTEKKTLLRQLHNRVWHATTPANAELILSDGYIRPDGISAYPTAYCRLNGGVSLFDFRLPMKEILGNRDWWTFFSPENARPTLVWFGLDESKLPLLSSGRETLREWMDAEAFGARIIAPLEAIHRGPVAVSAISGMLLFDSNAYCRFSTVAASDMRTALVERAAGTTNITSA
jgi:hypothetical protein